MLERYIKKLDKGLRSPAQEVTLKDIREGRLRVQVEGNRIKEVRMTEEERRFYATGIIRMLMDSTCKVGSNPYKAMSKLQDIRELEKLESSSIVMKKAKAYVVEERGSEKYIRFYYDIFVEMRQRSEYKKELEGFKKELVRKYCK